MTLHIYLTRAKHLHLRVKLRDTGKREKKTNDSYKKDLQRGSYFLLENPLDIALVN